MNPKAQKLLRRYLKLSRERRRWHEERPTREQNMLRLIHRIGR